MKKIFWNSKFLTLEATYDLLNKHILLTKSFTGFQYLPFIIKSCRLKPLKYLQHRSNKVVLHKTWVDEFDKQLKIEENKSLSIQQSEEGSPKCCTDLYYGLSLLNIINISKLIYIRFNNDQQIISCLGLDDYFRTFQIKNNKWERISTLTLGLDTLVTIYNKKFLTHFINLTTCAGTKELLSYVPMPSELKKELPIEIEREIF